jgi:hypothetical protein
MLEAADFSGASALSANKKAVVCSIDGQNRTGRPSKVAAQTQHFPDDARNVAHIQFLQEAARLDIAPDPFDHADERGAVFGLQDRRGGAPREARRLLGSLFDSWAA